MLLIYLGVHHHEELRLMTGRSFDQTPLVRFVAFFAIVFGLYLGLPGFVTILQKPGKVQFDWLRFLVIGIPAFLICISGALVFYFKTDDLVQFTFSIYSKFSSLGTALAGSACGYTLLSSVNKREAMDSVQERRYPLAKIITLCIMAVIILYVALNGIIHPLKLISAATDVSDADNYTIAVGDVVPKQINYVLAFENFSYNSALSKAFDDDKIRIEPKGRLRKLVDGKIFMEKAGYIIGGEGNRVTLTISYRVGPFAGEAYSTLSESLSPEILEELKDSLFDAELVFEVDNKIRRYDLTDYQKEIQD